MSEFQSNQQLNKGRYQIVKELGRGGFGINYLAQDKNSNKLVCIKTLHLRRLKENYRNKQGNLNSFDLYLDELQEKFASEAMVLSQLEHPHIVKVYPQLFQERGLWCMVMEYIEGKNLAQYLENNGIFSEAEALNIIQQIGEALSYLHQKNYLHRDIKPQNILLRDKDKSAILIDFGLAREVDFDESMELTVAGTRLYAPPEQFKKRSKFTPAADIFSLSATLSVLLTVEEPPFLPCFDPPKEINPNITQQVNDAIVRGMEWDYRQRPQSVKQWFKLLGIGELLSEVGIDYQKLQQLLAAGKWQEADGETEERMLELMEKKDGFNLFSEKRLNLNCKDLQTMNQLWNHYSEGKFGFSVQKDIWHKCGGKSREYNINVYEKFGDRVGWRKGGNWLNYHQLICDRNLPLDAPDGQFPTGTLAVWLLICGESRQNLTKLSECSIN